MTYSHHDASGLLGPNDPPAYEILNPEGTAPLVLICDHASNRVPAALGDLGLPPEAFSRHIAIDIGAAETTRRLAQRLNAPAVLCNYSRLVIDCNRLPGDPAAIPAESDKTPVPANRDLSDLEAERRAQDIFWPYHQAIGEALAHQWRRMPDMPPALVAVHSFTPRMADGEPRPWEIGFLWNHDDRLTVPMLTAMKVKGFCVGDNEPYSGRLLNGTCDRHAQSAGLPHVSIEIRQDLISDTAGCTAWAEHVAEALDPLLGHPDIHRVVRY